MRPAKTRAIKPAKTTSIEIDALRIIKEKVEHARSLAMTSIALSELHHKIHGEKDDDDTAEAVSWYTEYFSGSVGMAILALAESIEQDLSFAEEELSPHVSEVSS